MQGGHHHFKGGLFHLGVHIHRDAAAIIFDRHTAIRMDKDSIRLMT
jgi:hypothetical protein